MRKLGKKQTLHDTRTLRLAKLLSPDIPAPPPVVDFYATRVGDGAGGGWGMMANDTTGDCTIAAAAHMELCWTANAAARTAGEDVPSFTASDEQILAAYSAVSGYVAGDSYTDQGAYSLDVLNYWRQVGIAGRRILAYVALEPQNIEHVKQAVWLFEGCYIGLQLPLTAETQLNFGVAWDVDGDGLDRDAQPGSWGGHAVNVVGYDADGLTVVSWGALQKMTWAFWAKYCDEAYAVLSQDMLVKGLCPAGFDLGALQEFLGDIGGAGSPPAPVPPMPIPPSPQPVDRAERLAIVIFTGLGTEPTGECCGMRDLARKIADEYPDYEVKIMAVGWDQKPPEPYTEGPDGLCRFVRDRLIEFAPTKLIRLDHSFGGALGTFADQWLWTWYSGPQKDSPPYRFDLVIKFDPVPNSVRFGDGQGPGWFEPVAVVPRVLDIYQRNGAILCIKGEPLFVQKGVQNIDVSKWNNPSLGHVTLLGLKGIIEDSRVQERVMQEVDLAMRTGVAA